jgi:Fic/DOC family N-terminal
MYVRREAVLSSQIEGTQSTLSSMLFPVSAHLLRELTAVTETVPRTT